jgi:uncharacterized protein (TIGR04551 family)
MPPRLPLTLWLASTVTVLATLATGSPAWAQFGGMRPGGQPGVGSPAPQDTKEGPAEKAPDERTESPALQPLPAWPQQREKATQFFQINGYMRGRAYLFHNLNLGFYEGASGPKSPFFIPFTEFGQTGKVADNGHPTSCAQREGSDCRTDNITSADMRLRLEPTINVTDQVRVKAQLDIFDNLVMGTTPDSYFLNNSPTPRGATTDVVIPAFSRTQQSPEGGQNAVFSSIRAKRAWAEVRTPFAELRFGRMPSHWGMGMLVNNGECLDCDYGVNADRVMVATKLWGHFFTFLWDWVATGPTTQILGPQQNQGVFYNADTLDDVSQWVLALGKMDKPEELKEKLDKGKAVMNYGGYFVYRQQDWAQRTNPSDYTQNTYRQLQDNLAPRKARAFIGDIWLRLNWKKLHLEVEGALIAGKLGNLQDQFAAIAGETTILSGGFAFKGHYKLLRDALKIFLEVGYASGDANEDVNGQLNFRFANPNANAPPGFNRISRFTFDPDYHVDLILFRRILGTVNNAVYFKPGVSYDILDNFTARADLMYAIAANPVAYPGNSYNLGLEIDASLMYKNEEEGFYAGVTYGVLFPFGALSLPASIYGPQFAHDAETAQTFQGRLAVKF